MYYAFQNLTCLVRVEWATKASLFLKELCSKIPSGKYSELTWTVTNRKWVCMAWWEFLYLVLEWSLCGLCYVCRKNAPFSMHFRPLVKTRKGRNTALRRHSKEKRGTKTTFSLRKLTIATFTDQSIRNWAEFGQIFIAFIGAIHVPSHLMERVSRNQTVRLVCRVYSIMNIKKWGGKARYKWGSDQTNLDMEIRTSLLPFLL